MQRDNRLDVLRIIAIAMVVLCHAVEEIYRWDISFIANLSVPSRWFAFFAFTVGRLGVPIFMFITGYLLIDREYDEKGIINFWKYNFCQLLITTGIWIVFYDVFLKYFNSEPFKWNTLLKNLLFLEQVRMGHMWYMSMILGMYIFLPLVARAVKKISFEIIIVPYALALLYLTILPVISDILISINKSGIYQVLSLEYSGGYYGVIIFSGYLYKRFFCKKKINIYLAIITGAVSFLCVVFLQIHYFSRGFSYAVWYHWFPLLLVSGTIFVCVMNTAQYSVKSFKPVIENLGKCSFGVYLVHFPLLMLVNRYLPLQGILPVRVLYLFAVGLVLSYGIVFSFSKIKKIRTILFYIK